MQWILVPVVTDADATRRGIRIVDEHFDSERRRHARFERVQSQPCDRLRRYDRRVDEY
jgi:hypothetical protein